MVPHLCSVNNISAGFFEEMSTERLLRELSDYSMKSLQKILFGTFFFFLKGVQTIFYKGTNDTGLTSLHCHNLLKERSENSTNRECMEMIIEWHQ